MSYEYQGIARSLKEARESSALSQRALAEKSGVLQTRISKIESGASDFRVSTLIALARALDLELALVPRKALSAVQSVVRASEPTAIASGTTAGARKEFERFQQAIAGMSNDTKATPEFAQLQRQLRDLANFQLDKSKLDALSEIRKTLQPLTDHQAGWDALRKTIQKLQSMRNAVAHASATVPRIDTVKPAYRLDDEDNHG